MGYTLPVPAPALCKNADSWIRLSWSKTWRCSLESSLCQIYGHFVLQRKWRDASYQTPCNWGYLSPKAAFFCTEYVRCLLTWTSKTSASICSWTLPRLQTQSMRSGWEERQIAFYPLIFLSSFNTLPYIQIPSSPSATSIASMQQVKKIYAWMVEF